MSRLPVSFNTIFNSLEVKPYQVPLPSRLNIILVTLNEGELHIVVAINIILFTLNEGELHIAVSTSRHHHQTYLPLSTILDLSSERIMLRALFICRLDEPLLRVSQNPPSNLQLYSK